MARLVLYLNSILLLLMVACKQSVPSLKVLSDDKELNSKADVLYYKNDHFNGSVVELFPNADTLSIAEYQNGLMDGKYSSWYANKQINEIRYYSKGYKTGEHTGYWPNGKKRFLYHLQKDVYEGNVKEWAENGQLLNDFNYINGQECGMQRVYYSNGIVKANYEVRNGKIYGNIGSKNCASPYTEAVH